MVFVLQGLCSWSLCGVVCEIYSGSEINLVLKYHNVIFLPYRLGCFLNERKNTQLNRIKVVYIYQS